jgi:RecB family endonuclease NucS
VASISSEQRAQLLAFIGQGKDDVHELEELTGIPWRSIRSIKANIKMGHVIVPEETESDEVLDAIETTFGLERDLQNALRKNIGDLEKGLSIIDDGKERKVASGFIDITARAKDGATVVIELKAGPADRDAIGQILAYMGDLMATEKVVRGVLVAGEFTARAIAAARATQNLQLISYGFKFSFQAVSPISVPA